MRKINNKFDRVPKMNRKLNTDNTDKFMDHGIDIENRVIHLFDDIGAETTGMVVKGIQLMLAKNKERDIDIYINSFGGCPYSAFGLYNFIRTLKTVTINTYNIGCAMSAGSIIFMSGDNRYMYEDTVFMFHSVASGVDGKLFEIVTEAEECKKIQQQMCAIYAKHTNKTEKQWASLLKHENKFYRSDIAVEYGIIHKVIVDNSDIKT